MTATEPAVELRDHPAKFHDDLLHTIRDLLLAHDVPPGEPVIDPFAGTGKIHQLADMWDTTGVELEPEWAGHHERTMIGDARHLDRLFDPGSFAACVTSPCLRQDHRILTADLRWVPAGDVKQGERIVAFDEFPQGVNTLGRSLRRRWQFADVVSSEPARKPCVRVHLDNGDSIVCTVEHPWLATRYADRSAPTRWVRADRLLDEAPFVFRQLEPWSTATGYDAGWLAGMMDGEGSLSFGAHGSPKLCVSQVVGPVSDRYQARLMARGYDVNVIRRKGAPAQRQQVENTYVVGGWPGILRALGELRPERLLAKFQAGDLSTRTLQADKVAVVAVEPCGDRDVQVIETTAGTYIGEGYLHHNCYGNRFADTYTRSTITCKPCKGTGHVPDDKAPIGSRPCETCDGSGRRATRRYNYASSLGRRPSQGSSAVLHWGPAYREFHDTCWRQVRHVVIPGGLFILNIKDHQRDRRRQYVTDWHVRTLGRLGFRYLTAQAVDTGSMRHGENWEARFPEQLIVFEAPGIHQLDLGGAP